MPGAGGNTGTAQVAKAPADGYTLLVISTGFMVNPSLYAKVPYDPVKDFAPITLIAASPNVLVVHPDVPAKSVKELIALIKANPGKYSYAQPALGSTPHLGGELFKMTLQSRSGDGAVSRRRARHHLDHRRPHADRLHRTAAGDHRRQGRQGPRARGDGGEARQRAAGCADHGRSGRRRIRRPTR